jgi:hypothetical protein
MAETFDYLDSSPVVSLTVGELKNLIVEAARGNEVCVTELAQKWDGGEMILKPGQGDLQEKVIPIETFFHKIVMVRDRLRVLEQKINSNKAIADAEKVELQQYITRIYGSLTSFNILFKFRDDQFIGESKKL